VLRCQLPKRNDFYPRACEDDLDDWTRHTSKYWSDVGKDDTLNLCAVSGQRSRGRCPEQDAWFCSPEHQRERSWASKRGGGRQCRPRFSVFRECELVVEEEPRPTPTEDDGGDGDDEEEAEKFDGAPLFPSSGNGDADADLTQSDLNAMMTGNAVYEAVTTGVTDPTTLAFYVRMGVGGDENDVRGQCLRYSRWPAGEGMGDGGEEDDDGDRDDDDEEEEDGAGAGPLWLSSDDQPPPPLSRRRDDATCPPVDDADGPPGGDVVAPSFPPPCEYCGARRDFEFQILPQMLSCLSADDVPSSPGRSTTTAAPTTAESDLAVLLEASSMIESGMDLPAGFKERHDEAVARARGRLLGSAPDGGGSGGGPPGGGGSLLGVDWGVIAVYTCTASCGDGGVVSEENGCYREEVAWMQPPLD
jgi:pre-rRNA-processing protein TSR4